MSSHSNRVYDWQRLASPAPSCSSGSAGSHHGAQRPPADPFLGLYPSAPHLRPIELPETDGPMLGFASPGYSSGSSSSRSRPMSLPPSHGTALGIYGMSPSPHGMGSGASASASAPSMHPLLRGDTATLSTPLVYNALRAPSSHGAHALRSADGARLSSHDLALPATHPPCPALRVSLLLYAGTPRRFLWDITLTPSRRTSAPPAGPRPLTLGDALASLHLSLLVPVADTELRQFSAHDVQNANAVYAARRAAYPSSPAGLVRADFLFGCTEFAGFVRNRDGSFAIRMTPPSALA